MNTIITIAYRDFLKFARDPMRIVSTLVFPVVFVVVLGGSLQKNLGSEAGYNFKTFTFTGVFIQTLFQSAALGVISLIEDRENDFSQEIFVAPVSRYSILFGKISGETLVAMIQGLVLLALGFAIRVPLDLTYTLALIPIGLVACLFGGAFGIMLLANLQNQRTAQQIFPFVLLPQFFLAGVFTPIKVLPWYLDVISRISPLRYAVDLGRGVYYHGSTQHDKVVLDPVLLNLAVMSAMFLVFMVAGTWLFVRRESNR